MKLWQIINILNSISEHFQFNFHLLFVSFYPITAYYPLFCVHTTLNKPIEIYFTGKFRRIENEC